MERDPPDKVVGLGVVPLAGAEVLIEEFRTSRGRARALSSLLS
jgi:hypothetical protein